MGRQCTVDSISYTVMLGRDGRNAPIRVRHSEDDIPHLLDEINSLWVPSTAAPQPRR